MAYNNGRPNQKKSRPNWFDNQIQNLGPDFLSKLKVEDIARDCRVIFKDLARGNIDVIKYHQYLCNPDLISTMWAECNKKYNEYNILSMAMDMYIYNLNNVPIQGVPMVLPEQMSQIAMVHQVVGAKRTVYGQILAAIERARTTYDMASAYIPLPSIIGKYASVLD